VVSGGKKLLSGTDFLTVKTKEARAACIQKLGSCQLATNILFINKDSGWKRMQACIPLLRTAAQAE
jgi:hypothetical protein